MKPNLTKGMTNNQIELQALHVAEDLIKRGANLEAECIMLLCQRPRLKRHEQLAENT